jgi:Sec-independent protein translocase protein TatA
MDKQFTVGWVFMVSVLGAYFLLGVLATGGVIPPASVLVLVLVLWFSVYKLRHKGLSNRGLVRKMRTDLEEKFDGMREKIAQQEAHRLAALEQEEQARLEREKRRAEGERRRASGPTKDPAVGKYADMIESRVREREQAGRGSEGP